MAKTSELIYNEARNEVIFIKPLSSISRLLKPNPKELIDCLRFGPAYFLQGRDSYNPPQTARPFPIQCTDIARFKSVSIYVHEKEPILSQPADALGRFLNHEFTSASACLGVKVTSSSFAASGVNASNLGGQVAAVKFFVQDP
jgi:hypothetical protein